MLQNILWFMGSSKQAIQQGEWHKQGNADRTESVLGKPESSSARTFCFKIPMDRISFFFWIFIVTSCSGASVVSRHLVPHHADRHKLKEYYSFIVS